MDQKLTDWQGNGSNSHLAITAFLNRYMVVEHFMDVLKRGHKQSVIY